MGKDIHTSGHKGACQAVCPVIDVGSAPRCRELLVGVGGGFLQEVRRTVTIPVASFLDVSASNAVREQAWLLDLVLQGVCVCVWGEVCVCVCACALERDSLRSILAPWGSVDQELEQGRSWALMTGQASQMTREELPHAHSSGLPPCQGASVPTQRLPCGQWMRVSSARSSLPGRSLGVAGSTWFWVPFSAGVRFISVSSCLGSVCGTP